MQRRKVWSLSAVLLLLLLLQRLAGTQQAAATKGKSYFLMDANGSYRYAYDTGNGIEGAQSADPANEVTGHYTYVERGVPYTVHYRAGVNGYQPEVITAAGAAVPLPQTALSVDRPAALQPGLNHVFATFGSGASNTQPTLQFIAAALQSMQRQPLQLSFNSQHGQLQQLAANSANGGAASSTARPPTLISRADAAQINRLAEMPAAGGASTAEAPMRPYAFAYGSNADLSAHSESADSAGNVVGKYSYRDEAGFHELAYKAGDDIGFQIVGGNLAQLNANANDANLHLKRNLHSNSNQFQYGNSSFHSNLNKNKKLNSNINSNLNSNFNSNLNSKLNSNINSNLNFNLNQNSNVNRLFTSNFNLNSYSNSNLNPNPIRNSNSNSFSYTSKQQSTPQLLVSVTHGPHGSYNYKVEPLRHIVSNALQHPTERVSHKF